MCACNNPGSQNNASPNTPAVKAATYTPQTAPPTMVATAAQPYTPGNQTASLGKLPALGRIIPRTRTFVV